MKVTRQEDIAVFGFFWIFVAGHEKYGNRQMVPKSAFLYVLLAFPYTVPVKKNNTGTYVL